MSKLSQFAAACAAVVCAFGAVAQPLDQCKVTAEAGAWRVFLCFDIIAP